MVPKRKRVTKDLFLIIMKQGKVASGSFFLFRYIPEKTPHYAFVAPKTVAKKAVDRNHLRRQGYSALSLYPITTNAGIFFYKKEAKKASFNQIKEDVKQILQKTHII